MNEFSGQTVPGLYGGTKLGGAGGGALNAIPQDHQHESSATATILVKSRETSEALTKVLQRLQDINTRIRGPHPRPTAGETNAAKPQGLAAEIGALLAMHDALITAIYREITQLEDFV